MENKDQSSSLSEPSSQDASSSNKNACDSIIYLQSLLKEEQVIHERCKHLSTYINFL